MPMTVMSWTTLSTHTVAPWPVNMSNRVAATPSSRVGTTTPAPSVSARRSRKRRVVAAMEIAVA